MANYNFINQDFIGIRIENADLSNSSIINC